VFSDCIYTITTANLTENKWRCWAWFKDLEEAERAVNNCGNFFWEYYYDTLVIEEVPRGAISLEYREWWYEWSGDSNDGEWHMASKPEPIKGIIHFGVG